jgi:hypothetical protein
MLKASWLRLKSGPGQRLDRAAAMNRGKAATPQGSSLLMVYAVVPADVSLERTAAVAGRVPGICRLSHGRFRLAGRAAWPELADGGTRAGSAHLPGGHAAMRAAG